MTEKNVDVPVSYTLISPFSADIYCICSYYPDAQNNIILNEVTPITWRDRLRLLHFVRSSVTFRSFRYGNVPLPHLFTRHILVIFRPQTSISALHESILWFHYIVSSTDKRCLTVFLYRSWPVNRTRCDNLPWRH